MSDRFFLDTNIFIYSLDRSAPRKAQKAAQLVREAVSTHKGIISYQVVQEFLNVALKRFAQPMSTVDAERYITSVFRPLLTVQSSAALFSEALALQGSSRLSWYDSLIVASAIRGQCDVLYTEDLQHRQRFGNLQVVNPFL
jgi:predicted nucleic acid-binding protein